MQSAKKSTRILSALSMAAAAALTASAAHAAPTLSLYYGEDTSFANSNNGVYVGTGYNGASPNFNGAGEQQVLSGASAVSVPASNAGPVTITVPVGDYLSLAVDAVLTGNPNPSAGVKSSGNKNQIQPAFMGLSELGMAVSSSDAHATLLTPVATGSDTAGTPDTTVNGVPAYTSSASINTSFGANGGSAPTPNWGTTGQGNVAPNEPGFSGSQNQGGVGFFNGGLVGFITGGNTSVTANSSTGVATVANMASSSAAYSTSTAFFDSLVFQALKTGTVTLNAFDVTNSTEYWTNLSANPTSTSAATSYQASNGFNGTVNSLPLLVIQIGGGTKPPALISYAASNPTGYGSTEGALTVTGGHGSYTVSQVTGLSGGVGNVTFTGFNPATDEQIFALDITQANGAQATPAELATIVADINGGGSVTQSAGVTATTSSPTPNPFGSQYNLFVDPSGLASGDFGFNLGNDTGLAGLQVSAVAVVPEPMTLGLLALGGVGLMARRHRRKA